MTVQQLYDARDAEPFRPFAIYLADGRSLTVRHPEFLSIARRSRTAIVFETDDSREVIDVDLVTSVRVAVTISATK